MTQITLHANHCWIDTTPQNLGKNYGDFGIYILGIKNAQGRIVPYYVGKSESSISRRVKDHIQAITAPTTTYTIFSSAFFANRGILKDFIRRVPQPYSKSSYPHSLFGSSILYLNKEYFFSHSNIVGHFVNPIGSQWPLNLLSGFSKTLPLFNQAVNVQNTIFKPGSLYFTTLVPNIIFNGFPNKTQQDQLKCLETFVKFSLVVNTIGKSQSLDTMKKNLNGIPVSINIQGIPCNGLKNEFYPTPR